MLNHGRQIAIDERTFVCVLVPTPTHLRFYVNDTCTGTPWRGSITDAEGNIPLPASFNVSASADPVSTTWAVRFRRRPTLSRTVRPLRP